MSRILISLVMLLAVFPFTGCTDDSIPRAKLGNAGSTDGPYGIKEMVVSDTSGGFSDFAYGFVSSYPGAYATISGLGIPTHVKGYWSKHPESTTDSPIYYRIDSAINSKLATEKMKALENAYKNFEPSGASVQVVVDKAHLKIFYTFSCFSSSDDCSKKEGSDPNGWIVRSPKDITDVVVLFSGDGETSLKPFPTSPYDNRIIRAVNVGETVVSEATLQDVDLVSHEVNDQIVLPTSFSVNWRKKLNPDAEYSKWQFDNYQLTGDFSALDMMEESIQAYRNAMNGYIKTSTFDIFAEDENLVITYSADCLTDTPGQRCNVAEDPKKRWRYFDELGRHAVVLFEGKGTLIAHSNQ
ncbi:hypothetical protein [Grimontia sp. NTOU-MAR1]|uniref:hypothetical protein n=1 Tax=Grimontia sp. NTOU-MAR1 TaxID=3111011 RepID=UPI002DBEFA79|nr:hypothetical protein [Grimontia sp. NTOU-MAR1]WRV99297.1 hypothetical protein VP504_07845 [Grimontia sp. NTOU-MAR1]